MRTPATQQENNPDQKWVRDQDKHFTWQIRTRKDAPRPWSVAARFTEQRDTTTRLLERLKSKTLTTPSAGEDASSRNCPSAAGGSRHGAAAAETVGFSQNCLCSSRGTQHSHACVVAGADRARSHRNLPLNVSSSLSQQHPGREATVLSVGGWVHQARCSPIMECH